MTQLAYVFKEAFNNLGRNALGRTRGGVVAGRVAWVEADPGFGVDG